MLYYYKKAEYAKYLRHLVGQTLSVIIFFAYVVLIIATTHKKKLFQLLKKFQTNIACKNLFQIFTYIEKRQKERKKEKQKCVFSGLKRDFVCKQTFIFCFYVPPSSPLPPLPFSSFCTDDKCVGTFH